MSDPRDWDLEYDGAAPALPPEMSRKKKTKEEIYWTELLFGKKYPHIQRTFLSEYGF